MGIPTAIAPELAVTWDELARLRSLTKLPLIVKGIQHPDDAKRAIDVGVDAIYCSNHGGRQANGGIASIDLLPALVAECGKRQSGSIPASARGPM